MLTCWSLFSAINVTLMNDSVENIKNEPKEVLNFAKKKLRVIYKKEPPSPPFWSKCFALFPLQFTLAPSPHYTYFLTIPLSNNSNYQFSIFFQQSSLSLLLLSLSLLSVLLLSLLLRLQLLFSLFILILSLLLSLIVLSLLFLLLRLQKSVIVVVYARIVIVVVVGIVIVAKNVTFATGFEHDKKLYKNIKVTVSPVKS